MDSDSEVDSDWEFELDAVDVDYQEDFKNYATLELGLNLESTDADLAWVAWEAFTRPVPEGWSEHTDATGRVYFHNWVIRESTWSHPDDEMFKSLLGIIIGLRAERPFPSEARRSQVMQDHLAQIYRDAERDLLNWSGPYSKEGGGEYFFNERFKESMWESPSERWERQLATRQAVLHRCLLIDWPHASPKDPSTAQVRSLSDAADAVAHSLAPKEDDEMSDRSAKSQLTMHSCRSARTARSDRSTRSARSARSQTPRGKRQADAPLPSNVPTPLPPPSRKEELAPLPAILRSQSETLPRFGADEEDSPSVVLPKEPATDSADKEKVFSPDSVATEEVDLEGGTRMASEDMTSVEKSENKTVVEVAALQDISFTDAEAEMKAAEERSLAEAKKKLAEDREASAEKPVAEEKKNEERAAADEATAETEKKIAEEQEAAEKAAIEKQLVEERAIAEEAIAETDKKITEERETAEKEAIEKQLAEERAVAEEAAAETEKKLAEERETAEKAAVEKQLAEQRAAAEEEDAKTEKKRLSSIRVPKLSLSSMQSAEDVHVDEPPQFEDQVEVETSNIKGKSRTKSADVGSPSARKKTQSLADAVDLGSPAAAVPALDLRLKNALDAFLHNGNPSLDLEHFVNPEQRSRAWSVVEQYPGLRCEIDGGRMKVFKEDSPKSWDNIPKGDVVDSADIAGGLAAEKSVVNSDLIKKLSEDYSSDMSTVSHLSSRKQPLEECSRARQPSCSPTCSSADGNSVQFFNIADPDAMDDGDEADQVRQWLRKLGLGRYFEQLELQGFDNMKILASLNDDQVKVLMDLCPMPLLHEQQLRRGLARLNADYHCEENMTTSA